MEEEDEWVWVYDSFQKRVRFSDYLFYSKSVIHTLGVKWIKDAEAPNT
jgi:hypothetical protein